MINGTQATPDTAERTAVKPPSGQAAADALPGLRQREGGAGDPERRGLSHPRLGSPAASRTAIGFRSASTGLGRAVLFAVSLGLWLLAATSAEAATVSERPQLFSFDGSDSSAGAFAGIQRLGVDQSSGTVYVVETGHSVVDKFDADGNAVDFSPAHPTSSLSGGETPAGGFGFNGDSDISIDNSGGGGQGRVFVSAELGPVVALDPQGNYLWDLDGFDENCGIGIDVSGHLWVGQYGIPEATEFAATGSPPAQIGSVADTTGHLCRLDFDAAGNLYMNQYRGAVDKYTGGAYASTLDSGNNADVAVDQTSSTGHIFTIHPQGFSEYDSSGALLGASGSSTIGDGRGIAYYAAADRVYVADGASNSVRVFGPAVTGTVADVSADAPTEPAISSATLNGTVNPQGVPNSYRFEWKPASIPHWGSARSSAFQSLPEDGVIHQVSVSASGLSGNTTYQARLVAINTANGLRNVSNVVEFTTLTPSPPIASITASSDVTASSAQIDGEVNPNGDAGTTWEVELSTDPSCGSGFSAQAFHQLESEATENVPVSESRSALLPGQHYCVRIRAANAGGESSSSTREFTTLSVLPAQIETIGASHRTDTSARLNARINPEGSVATYHFEYSGDGVQWTALPDLQSSPSREQIVVSQQLTGLSPETSYRYRFVAENDIGPVSAGEHALSTRSTAEMVLPERGIELVNTPEKGNQNAITTDAGSMTPTGDQVFWSVPGGAPGGSTGAGSVFLASRTAGGWVSRGIVPPADRQSGGGDAHYRLLAIAPDLSHFVFKVDEGLLSISPYSFVRVNANQEQEALRDFPASNNDEIKLNVSTDTSSVISKDPSDNLLYDFAASPPQLLSFLPDGSVPGCGLSGNPPGWFPIYPWISTDASHVFFNSRGNDCSGPGLVYRRDRESETTQLISGPAVAGSNGPAMFIRASGDGSRVIYLSQSKLATDDQNSDWDVYRYADGVGNECVTCLVSDADVNVGGTSNVEHSVVVSPDLSRIYFRSSRQLDGQGNAGNCQETQGNCNFYEVHDGELSFVATVRDIDRVSSSTSWLGAGGSVLVFAAHHDGITSDVTEGTRQLYRYDDRDQSTECISCVAQGPSRIEVGNAFTGNVEPALSADGETIAFETKAPLLPADVNGAADVYEWRRGSLRLVTDGETVFPAGLSAPAVKGMDASGDNILFSAAAGALTGFERDNVGNLYDARVGGGFPRSGTPARCSEDACQGPLQAPATQSPAGSAAIAGPGDSEVKRRAKHPRRGKHRHRLRNRHPKKRGAAKRGSGANHDRVAKTQREDG
jgi:hypothetical protein